jgi:hypothetical protein
MQNNNLQHLGVPRFIARGVHEGLQQNGQDLRFLVMDQYSYDLQTILNETDHQLEENFVIQLILYSFE